jgi:predicted acylesterase/phospholipase RssA
MIKVLSIDGGGIRGIIPAVVLAAIEQHTGQSICKIFDLIAGTSAGGIIALGLAKPGERGEPAYTAEDLVQLYETEGQRIFSRSLWRRIYALDNLTEAKYSADGIEAVLDKYFDKTGLSEALTNLLITSYEIEQRVPFFFRSHRAQQDPNSYDFPMKTVGRATSAAPTYFEPARIKAADNSNYALIDGGVFANNPAMCAYAETRDRQVFPGGDTNVLVVSLGTGVLTRKIPFDEAKDWGLAGWTQPLLGVIFDGVSSTTHYQLKQICRDQLGVDHYYRFQAPLSHANDDLDDASNANIRALKLLAEDILKNQSQDLNELCELLTQEKPQRHQAEVSPAHPMNS